MQNSSAGIYLASLMYTIYCSLLVYVASSSAGGYCLFFPGKGPGNPKHVVPRQVGIVVGRDFVRKYHVDLPLLRPLKTVVDQNQCIRWEARKNEGARALAMIRRQVVSRGRRSRQQQKAGSSGSISGGAVTGMVGQATAAAAAAREGGREETPAGGTAGLPGLCPAAVIIARAVEAVLSGSTSAFGGDGGSATASEAVTPPPEGLRTAGVGGEKSDDVVADGGEASQEERDRYREILEGLSRAHAALGKAVETAAESSCTPATGVDDAAAALPVDAKVFPPVSNWQFQCSSGGEVETEADKDGENEEENECLQQVRGLPRIRALIGGVGAGTYDAVVVLRARGRTSSQSRGMGAEQKTLHKAGMPLNVPLVFLAACRLS